MIYLQFTTTDPFLGIPEEIYHYDTNFGDKSAKFTLHVFLNKKREKRGNETRPLN